MDEEDMTGSKNLEESLRNKIMILNENAWDKRLTRYDIDRWLDNFTGRIVNKEKEKMVALFWLANFMYFGSKEVRALLRSLYRDVYMSTLACQAEDYLPVSAGIKERQEFIDQQIDKTLFVSLGNPSESGAHLLYFFRQENRITKRKFINASELFNVEQSGYFFRFFGIKKNEIKLAHKECLHYVFIDDLCGSGAQLLRYSDSVASLISELSPQAKTYFFSLFGSKSGLDKARSDGRFTYCESIFEMDSSYRALSENSRYFHGLDGEISRKDVVDVVEGYGQLLDKTYATGWKDGQLFMGFSHNIPDNCPAFIWYDTSIASAEEKDLDWVPIFKRYPKIYGS
ncbi:MAG: hypothetical protein KBT87_07485 [Gammaproteobacteria bacterium]|nr:hypothetical protein [Gammaproteobacteria bacterium]MBQ0774494.1 hypothetical protein [Gammaproteobacteria bacterium]